MEDEHLRRHPDHPSPYRRDAASRRVERGRPPLRALAPVTAAAVAYGVAALVWVALGPALPGGRWMAVHLFTLGTVTNLVATMTDHFARTLTKVEGDGRRGWRLGLLNAGVLLVLVSLPRGWPVVLASGAGATLVAIAWLVLALRRMRTRAVGARFGYIVRAYELAGVAFVGGGLLGALMGTGTLPTGWHEGPWAAHLALNVLGWGGLVLLATIVFFAPTVMRARMVATADRLARYALPLAAAGLVLAVAGLIVSAADGPIAGTGRAAAIVGLGGYALASALVCGPALATARRAVRSPQAYAIGAACAWFPVAAAAAAVTVAWPAFPPVEAIGIVLLVGVLGQAIIGALTYLLPMVTGGGAEARALQRRQLERLGALRVLVYNAGVLAVTAHSLWPDPPRPGSTVLATVGWGLVGASVLASVVLGLVATARGRRVARASPA